MVGVGKSSRINGSLVSRTHPVTPCTALTTRLVVGLDGSMIVLTMTVLSIFHPGRLMTQEIGLMTLGSESVVEMWTKGI